MTAILALTRPEPGVALVTLDNPPRNQLGAQALSQFLELLDELEADDDLRCLVITGTGASWCAGADLREERAQAVGESDRDPKSSFGALINRLEASRLPVVAAINGYAIGGGMELALACDVRIAAESASFVCAGVNVGLIASWYRLPRTIGLGPAKHVLLTGDRFGADWALRNGLVTEVHPDGDLLAAALAVATRIATRAPLSVEATKACANQAFELDADAAARLGAEAFGRVSSSYDHREAVSAFLDKRAPRFERR